MVKVSDVWAPGLATALTKMDVSVKGSNIILSKSAAEKVAVAVATDPRRNTVVDGSKPPLNLAEIVAEPIGFWLLPT